MRRRGKGVDRPAQHLRPAARGRAQAGLTCTPVSQFQLAHAEIDPRHGILRLQRQCMPIDIRGGHILAVENHHARQHRLDIPPSRRCGKRLQQQAAGPDPVVAAKVKPPKVDQQLDHVRREPQAGLGNRNGFVEPSGFCQLIGIFAKRRRKRRPSCRSLAQLIQRLVATPGGGECCGEQCFDLRVVAAPCRPLERGNGL